ncbi:MAG: TRAP transporter small permease, partial [Gammaproteobacteria bacterium]|nr:TRAP transporter small permease [Gammaproteobacteria bacterium]
MPKAIRLFVRYVDAVSRFVGRITMYLILAMMGILLFGAISRSFFNVPFIWVVEMAQFVMTA